MPRALELAIGPHLLARRRVIPLYNVDLPGWLNGQRGRPRFYFRSREGDVEIAAWGVTWQAFDPFQARQALSLLKDLSAGEPLSTQPLLLGGTGFDAGNGWAAFGHLRFWLPEIELRRVEDVTCALVYGAPDTMDLRELLPDSDATHQPAAPPALITLSHQVDRAQWCRNVDRALAAIAAGRVHKVVLSRCTHVRPARALAGLDWIHHWQVRNPGSFPFLIEPTQTDSFFGCSPERLFRMQAGRIETEAMAATVPRGFGQTEDDSLAQALHADDKSRRENDWVRQVIEQQLAPLCSSLSAAPQCDTVRLSRVQHMRRRIEGQLEPDVSPLDVLDALHPTPAVAGTPTKAARALIRELDGYPRGWYTGAVGYMGADHADMSVAIRSARRCGDRLCVYTGAGIVEGSDPEKEWQELNHKLATLLPQAEAL